MKKMFIIIGLISVMIVGGCSSDKVKTSENLEKALGYWLNESNTLDTYLFINGGDVYQGWQMYGGNFKIQHYYGDGKYEIAGDKLKLIPNDGIEVTWIIESINEESLTLKHDESRITYKRINDEDFKRGIGEIE